MLSVTRKNHLAVATNGQYSGLRILTQVSVSHGESNIVVKSGLKSLTRTNFSSSSPVNSNQSNSEVCGDYSSLRSCNLCNKSLTTGKDIYMYRGDQGFCSVECRSRQIMLDEGKERDAKAKKMLKASSRSCKGCETCKLLEELRQRRFQRSDNKAFSSMKQQPILSIS